ncbi:hypothetical protein [Variovorax sp. Sphag1AA]|uniref:hypothetical protein n=1 Tax=Variovorax sp. Sphag1AA TaxID=2587027 RepID=UPI00160A42F5|nr:hypothetical protein [Variovorax sp. Sphag1AA]MBB3178599.1 hypothetical protein [Variovorax sp. Sphag1AA]
MTSQTLTEKEVRDFAARAASRARCGACTPLWRPAWESVSGATQINHLSNVGSLRSEDAAESLDEYHPNGTYMWSPDAPIALGWHPYNQCAVWICKACDGAFLRYTEYGGYYQDERIRPLLADLIVVPDAHP